GAGSAAAVLRERDSSRSALRTSRPRARLRGWPGNGAAAGRGRSPARGNFWRPCSGDLSGKLAQEFRRGEAPPEKRRCVYFSAPFLIAALAASHSAWLSFTQPWPLQAFWPLQALLAVWQADWPLQPFTPSHFTLPSSPPPPASATLEKASAAA